MMKMRILFGSLLYLFIVYVQKVGSHEDHESLGELHNKLNEMRKQYQYLTEKFMKMQIDHEASLERERELGETQIKNLMEIIGKHKPVVKETEWKKRPRHLVSRASPSNQVAFSADLSHGLKGLGHHQPIIYNHVMLNLGNAYDKLNGEFTVPVSGIYYLNWSTMTGENQKQGTELVVNGKHMSYSYSSETNGSESSDKTVLIHLASGQKVWIQTDGNNSNHTLSGQGFNSFSGFLVYE